MKSVVKILLLGFGNPARADDGLGPAKAEKNESKNNSNSFSFISKLFISVILFLAYKIRI